MVKECLDDLWKIIIIAESGRSTPASLCSNATVADIPYSYEPSNDVTLCNNNNNKNVLAETLVEVAEEDIDEDDNRIRSGQTNKESREKATATSQLSNNNLLNSRRKSKQEPTTPRACSQKEEKNNINYETKQSLNRSANTTSESGSRRANKPLPQMDRPVWATVP